MADIKRQNEIIRFAQNGHREECKTDEERWLYDSVIRDMKNAAKWGLKMDLVHEPNIDDD